MRRQLKVSFWFTLFATAGIGVVYPVLVAAAGFIIPTVSLPSLLEHPIHSQELFHGRPSMSGGPQSGASNLSLTNPELWLQVEGRLKEHAKYLPIGTHVPRDLLFASASGFDPDISVQGALYQVPRINKVRPMSMEHLSELVDQHIQPKRLRFIGTRKVNVINLNESLSKRCHGGATHK